MNLRHALARSYDASPVKLGAIGVGASSSPTLDLGFEAASADFAPHGQWSAADPDVPLSAWRANVVLEEHYFRTAGALPAGTRAVLVLSSDLTDTISMSSNPARWLKEDRVAELKPGTPVIVTGSQDMGRAGMAYEVETVTTPKRRGWVFASDLKPE